MHTTSTRAPVRLPVVQSEPKLKQNCSSCANIRNCFAPAISDRHIVTNLLVCRIKRDIDRNRSTRLLLQMLQPKLSQLAFEITSALKLSSFESENVLRDLESETIEKLMTHYVLGEIGYPLHYLFGMPNGVIRRWASSFVTKARKHSSQLSIKDDDEERIEDALALAHPDNLANDPHRLIDERATRELAAQVEDVIDDGVTLRLAEYRVLKFCLDNASDAKRPLNGLHIHIAKAMGVVRSRATRIWSDARDKVAAMVEVE